MSLINWLIVLVYLVLATVGTIDIKPLTLLFLVLAIIIAKIVVEPFPAWLKRRAAE
jgi:small-conductance mechanosensitive channel